ncbi:MAG: IPT/TIG domain-containing protein [Acidimicrobiales bacterium]
MTAGHSGEPPVDRRDQRLVVSIVVVSAIVMGSAIALAFSAGTHQDLANLTPGTVGHRAHSEAASSRGAHTPPSTKPSVPAPPPPTAAGGTPVLSSLSPAAGGAGQTVTISGSGFLSANGQIVASFGGQVAPTDCPDQTTCVVSVPDMGGLSSAVPVTVTTDTGTSNTLTFDYGAVGVTGDGPASAHHRQARRLQPRAEVDGPDRATGPRLRSPSRSPMLRHSGSPLTPMVEAPSWSPTPEHPDDSMDGRPPDRTAHS